MTASVHYLRPLRVVPTDPRLDAERKMRAADDAWYAHPSAGTLVQFVAAKAAHATACLFERCRTDGAVDLPPAPEFTVLDEARHAWVKWLVRYECELDRRHINPATARREGDATEAGRLRYWAVRCYATYRAARAGLIERMP